ncbi:MAG: TVP38/TMEM64 family protein [Candidatus Lokiarchaeota archaeon]|nr:TVP38/TMEM64 family protein [Candidatus Lokiarchaeota archaeon]
MAVNNTDEQLDEKQTFSAKLKKYFKNLIDFSQIDKKTILYIIIFIFLVGISIFLLYWNYFVDRTFIYLIIAKWFVNPIFELEILGMLLFIGIMAIQGLLVPIPSEIVLLATGMIWGWALGGFMGVIGSMAAALLCFYVSKKGGRPLAKKFVGENAIDMADDLIQKYGIKVIIISRFIPFISFDVISYASGLVDIDVKKYSIGTLIGSIFRAFFYSIWGALLGFTPPIDTTDVQLIEDQAGIFNVILLIVLAVLAGMFLAYFLLARYYEKKKQERKDLSKV